MYKFSIEDTKLYHYILWDEIVKMLPYDTRGCLPLLKEDVYKKLQSKELLPKPKPITCCYLCDYYYDNCESCPLDKCELYYMAMEAVERKDVDEAVSLAKAIRDIYEKEV